VTRSETVLYHQLHPLSCWWTLWLGAAAHVPRVIPLGLAIIVFAWLNGFWTPSPIPPAG
jgi:hypothetical protein